MMNWNRERSGVTVAAVLIAGVYGALAAEKQRLLAVNPERGLGKPVRRIIISIPDRKLALLEDGLVVKTWRTAVGTESTPSPGGTYTIINRISRPAYYRPGKIIPPGPSNPVGTRWLGLSLRGFGIHGTNEPGSIGKKASHGCIRLRNQDIEELFELVRVGDVVELHRERDERLAEIFHSNSQSIPIPSGKTSPILVLASAR